MARITNLTNFLTDIANAIRLKTGGTAAIPAANFDTEISNIQIGELTPEEYAEAISLCKSILGIDD